MPITQGIPLKDDISIGTDAAKRLAHDVTAMSLRSCGRLKRFVGVIGCFCGLRRHSRTSLRYCSSNTFDVIRRGFALTQQLSSSISSMSSSLQINGKRPPSGILPSKIARASAFFSSKTPSRTSPSVVVKSLLGCSFLPRPPVKTSIASEV